MQKVVDTLRLLLSFAVLFSSLLPPASVAAPSHRPLLLPPQGPPLTLPNPQPTLLSLDSPPPPFADPPPPSLPARAEIDPHVVDPAQPLPLQFVPNRGQVDKDVLFHALGRGAEMVFKPGRLSLVLPSYSSRGSGQPGEVGAGRRSGLLKEMLDPDGIASVDIQLKGANLNAQIVPLKLLEGRVNFFLGNNPAQWRQDLPAYESLVYREIYPGINLRYDSRHYWK